MVKGLLISICIIFIGSCSVLDNKEEDIPTYISIKEIDLLTHEGQGTDDHKITYAWVYANDQFVGAYEIPALVPVLTQGTANIKVAGGIEVNGIGEFPDVYPFYEFYSADLTMKPGSIIDFSEDSVNAGENSNRRSFPILTYFDPGLVFNIEDFENTSIGNTFNIGVTEDPAEVFEGNVTGKITMPADTSYFFAKSSWNLDDVPKGNEVFLEINYLTNCPVGFGVYTLNPVERKIFGKGINPNGAWNKIYFRLTQEFAQNVNTNNFEIYLEIFKPDHISECEIYLDNIKLIYPG